MGLKFNPTTGLLDIAGTGLATLDSRYVNITGDTMTGLLTISVPTTTSKALVLKTTDDNSTNNIFEAQDSSGVAGTQINYDTTLATHRLYLKDAGSKTGTQDTYLQERPATARRVMMYMNPVGSTNNVVGFIVSPTGTTNRDVSVGMWPADIDSGANNETFGQMQLGGATEQGDLKFFTGNTSSSGTVRQDILFSPHRTEVLRLSTDTTQTFSARILAVASTRIGLIVQAAASSTVNTQEWQDSSGTTFLKVGRPALSGGSLTDNWLNLTATFTSPATQQQRGVLLSITSAGSSSVGQQALRVQLNAGYTGSAITTAMAFVNSAAGTGVGTYPTLTNANYGVVGGSRATTTGSNIGIAGDASGGNQNVGLVGDATTGKNSALNIGVLGYAHPAAASGMTIIGGFFGLYNAEPTYQSGALIADNGAQALPIFLGRDNGTTVFTVDDGGTTTIAVPTTSYKGLVLRTTDDNTTNKLFQVQSSASVESVGIDAVGQMVLTASGTTRTPLIIEAAASHGANTSLFQIQDSGASHLYFYVDGDGQTLLAPRGLIPSQAWPVQQTALNVVQRTKNNAGTEGSVIHRGGFFAVDMNNTVNNQSRIDGLNAFAYLTGSTTLTSAFGGVYGVRPIGNGAITNAGVVLGAYDASQLGSVSTSAVTTLNVFWGTMTFNKTVVTDAHFFHADAPTIGTGSVANLVGLYLPNITIGTTTNFAIYTNAGISSFGDHIKIRTDSKFLYFGTGDDATITYDGTNLLINPKLVGTGYANIQGKLLVDTEIEIDGSLNHDGTTVGLYGATPVVQATTADAASTFAANTSGIADDTATFDGYTIGQIVKALRNLGLLA